MLCGAQFVVVLDVTIVAIALPDIQRSLGFSPAGLQWVVSAYTLAFGGLLVVAGRAGDLLGQRRMFASGLVAFGAASLACALAPGPGVLVAARAVQGIGAAALTPAALAILTATFDAPPARRRAVGWWTAAAAGGGASGWVLGGVLVETFGWPAVFLVNVPLCTAAALAVRRVLGRDDPAPRDRHEPAPGGRHEPAPSGRHEPAPSGRHEPAPGRRDKPARARRRRPSRGVGRLDVPGAVAITVALTLLVFAFTRVEAAGGADPWTLASLAAAVVGLALFVRIERRAADPILPPWTLRKPAFAAATGVSVALTAATTPAMLLAILYQQGSLGRAALATGLWCTPFNLAVIAGSLLGPRIPRPRLAMTAGLAAVAAGATALIALSPAALAPAFLLMGSGLGVAAVASTASGTAALGEAEQGVAAGVLNAAAQIGTALGLAAVITLAAATDYRTGFAAAAAIAGAAALALTGSSLPSRRRPTTPRP
jgi:MFS family permease